MNAYCELAFGIIGSCDMKGSLLCVSLPMNAKKNVHNAFLNEVEQQFASLHDASAPCSSSTS